MQQENYIMNYAVLPQHIHSIRWTKHQMPVLPGPDIHIEEPMLLVSVLKFTPASMHHAGQYECEAFRQSYDHYPLCFNRAVITVEPGGTYRRALGQVW